MPAPTLRERQSEFALMTGKLILKAYEMGYEVTLGDTFRDPRLHGEYGFKVGYGASRSYHKLRLAIDLNLFKDGGFLQGTEAHKPLGEWWESQGGTWGGRFEDGNHYSWGEGK
ncbi:M15 family metallopeptidase [Thiothrix lacustris]|uniref:M15 family metallopeptidase n=1 Tax=Thiothrix lacustris TaxID=525917 RepID=UPI000570960A|nr:M15 family metallopeptidase [Thiothrix lacustris]